MAQSEIEAGRLVCPFNDDWSVKTLFIWFVMTARQNWVNSRLSPMDPGESRC